MSSSTFPDTNILLTAKDAQDQKNRSLETFYSTFRMIYDEEPSKNVCVCVSLMKTLFF